jgi:hypothetical protein
MTVHWVPAQPVDASAPVVQRSLPVFRYLEKVGHPRWHTPLEATKRLVGTIVVVLSATLVFIPIPLLSIALLAAVIVLAVATAAVWQMVVGAKWITGLWADGQSVWR